MAYTGAGTKANPYIVDNWRDLMSLCHIPNRWITLDPNAENKVMDLNAEGYELWKYFNLYSNITGNGWVIRNLHTGAFPIECGENDISDLHFVNMVGSSSPFHGGANFTNCTFTALLTGPACFCNGSQYLYPVFRNCSFNIAFLHTESADLFHGSGRMLGCAIRLTGSTAGLRLTDTGFLNTCSVTGNLVLEGGELRLDTGYGNCAFMLEVSGTGTVIAEESAGYPNLVDVDLLADTLTQTITGTNWYPLTTAQMQDADYLINTVGFPCTEVTEEE